MNKGNKFYCIVKKKCSVGANPWKYAKMKFVKVNHEGVLSPGNDKIKNLSVTSVSSVAKVDDRESSKR